ncbi:hypothetical protein ACWF7H_23720 [Peribacillus butanolivorans]
MEIHSTYQEKRIRVLDVPVLVIHATEDKVLPYVHSLALVNEIHYSSLLTKAQVMKNISLVGII